MSESSSTVWIDRGALELETKVGRSTELRAWPDAATAVGHLVDAGCRVVLVDVDDEPESAGFPNVERTTALPADASGWLVTGDPERSGAVRGRRLRTILVGPSDPDRGLAHRASDLEARSLVDAALTILTADAMPETGVAARA